MSVSTKDDTECTYVAEMDVRYSHIGIDGCAMLAKLVLTIRLSLFGPERLHSTTDEGNHIC